MLKQFTCASCCVVSVPVQETYCDGCVEEIVEYLERSEQSRHQYEAELYNRDSLAFNYNEDLEYQQRLQDGLGFSY